MRATSSSLLLLIALAGCPGDTNDPECTVDTQCSGGDVCARDGECLPPSDVRSARVTWTIRGMAASASTCAPTPDFHIYFNSNFASDSFGFAPVPCSSGSFFIDKLPTRFVEVEIGVDGRFDQTGFFDQTGTAAFDLTP